MPKELTRCCFNCKHCKKKYPLVIHKDTWECEVTGKEIEISDVFVEVICQKFKWAEMPEVDDEGKKD